MREGRGCWGRWGEYVEGLHVSLFLCFFVSLFLC